MIFASKVEMWNQLCSITASSACSLPTIIIKLIFVQNVSQYSIHLLLTAILSILYTRFSISTTFCKNSVTSSNGIRVPLFISTEIVRRSLINASWILTFSPYLISIHYLTEFFGSFYRWTCIFGILQDVGLRSRDIIAELRS